MYLIENYRAKPDIDASHRVLVIKLISPNQVLESGENSIHEIIGSEGLNTSVGIYFYRFKDINSISAFSKIGEVSRREGLIKRKSRGWLAPESYGDSYLKINNNGLEKGVFSDVKKITPENSMYFVFYELDIRNAFPKIDEIHAFSKHKNHFGQATRNKESVNTFTELGANLVWYSAAFDEVLSLRLPSGSPYPP